jgi:glycine/D-amino acid oxidase-like deaminating enzyme/nitrite reductase/ring-hydroxylating ferredoxin subunit
VRRASLWIETGPEQPTLPSLDRDVHADVAVVGGGIVGITTALLLTEAGASVVLIEGNRVARGVSGHTTSKVSSQHGLIYDRLRSDFGVEGARVYGQANEAALAWIAERVERDGIDCDFRRRSSFAYVRSSSERSRVENEAEAAQEAGLPAVLVEDTPLPFEVEAAVRFDLQAEFHIRKYLLALVEQLAASDLCRIYEGSRAVDVTTGAPCVVKTPRGRVRAEQVVIATHYPFLDRSFAFARVHPQRSYALVCRIDGPPPDGMHISGDSPTRSVRAVPVDGEELLLVGGEGHKTGTGGDTEERYRALERFAREHWNVTSLDYRWSSQDNRTIDGLPYVGQLNPWSKRIVMATGFAKWGITGGTAAARMLSDRLLGRDNEWAQLFDPNRLGPVLTSARSFAKENAAAGVRFVGDRIRKPGCRSIEELEPGEGDIVKHNGKKVAGYRSEDGELVAVASRCTHLGCQVNWNRAERSWDCPCHGSRFAPTGEVLHGPAVDRLEPKQLGR